MGLSHGAAILFFSLESAGSLLEVLGTLGIIPMLGLAGLHRQKQGPQVLANRPLPEEWLYAKVTGTVH